MILTSTFFPTRGFPVAGRVFLFEMWLPVCAGVLFFFLSINEALHTGDSGLLTNSFDPSQLSLHTAAYPDPGLV